MCNECFIWRKNVSFYGYLEFCFCEIHRFQNLWYHHRYCYIIEVTLVLISFESQVLSKWNLVEHWCAVWQIFLTSFWLNAGDWKLVPSPFMILIKWQYSKIWSFLMVNIYQFKMSLIHLFKKYETLESWHNCFFNNWSRLLNWKGPWN